MTILEEGEGENSLPSQPSVGIRDEIYARLLEIKDEDVMRHPDFRIELDSHFNRFPLSYAMDMMTSDRAEDVMVHIKLLAEAKDSDRRPSFYIRIVKPEELYREERTNDDGNGDVNNTMIESSSVVRVGASSGPYYEMTFSTRDRPKLLSQLSSLLSDVGLNIQEAHVFSTNDGFSIDAFLVDGCDDKSIDDLHKELQKVIEKSEKSLSGLSSSPLGYQESVQINIDKCEIDRSLLKRGKKIGSGSCGDLYHGIFLGQEVAIKYLKYELLNTAVRAEFFHEIEILSKVQHGNVVRFIGACTEPQLCLVTEYMAGGSVYDFTRMCPNTLELPVLLKISIDVCKGMEYLHQNGIIHRDLKTANLLMDANGVVKVADFGVARFQAHEGVIMTAETGTYRWMAPEVINHQPYNEKVDIFSFAIVLWELTTSKVPYDTMTPVQAAIGVRQGLRPTLQDNTHPKLQSLMQRCWDEVPSKRPSFSKLKIELEDFLQNFQLGNEKFQQPVNRVTSKQKRRHSIKDANISG
ncbi:Protein kinase family protein, putative, expressed [Zostera marina]|uniref:Protein kinase family protein, putative, expressed n=1 Tax=Zostera marina TaxID=29655 RepID=A0A0K9NUR4_ZOSMR|nr:Protein kinase family protein, putative, expressed [Zostera marina]